jgi:hypothetical protein
MTNKSLQYKKELIVAMELCHGIVSDACKSVGVSRVTYYDYYNNDPEFKTSIDEIDGSVLDFVEGKLFKLIEKGDVAAILFYLKTKGKRRGYIEKSEIDHTVNFPSLPSITIKTRNATD